MEKDNKQSPNSYFREKITNLTNTLYNLNYNVNIQSIQKNNLKRKEKKDVS